MEVFFGKKIKFDKTPTSTKLFFLTRILTVVTKLIAKKAQQTLQRKIISEEESEREQNGGIFRKKK